MRTQDKVKPVALLCSDLHLSSRAPAWRTAEPDWFEAMARPIKEIRDLATLHDIPIICSGDVFDRWNSPPELINFAAQHLPHMYAIPGQHDLPYHNLDDMHRSAYATLIRTSTIFHMAPGGRYYLPQSLKKTGVVVAVSPFPWGEPITPANCSQDLRDHKVIHVAAVHAYCWRKGKSFPGAPEDKRVGAYASQLQGYDVAVFGDNHQGFLGQAGDCIVYNNGGFMRRKSDEADYRPHVGLLMSDATVQLHYLDISKDLHIDTKAAKIVEDASFSVEEFVKELASLDSRSFSYPSAVKEYLETYEVSPGARKIILDSINNTDK